MANLKHGSTGDEVKKLQTALGFTGKDVDGIFGNKTEAAVKEYQTKNNLAVDGIAGKNTLGSLYNTSSNKNTSTTSNKPKASSGSTKATTGTTGSGTTSSGTKATGTATNSFTTPAGNTYDSFTYEDFIYDPFQGSDTLNQAWATLGQLQGNAPGSWSDPYAEQRKGYLDQYENRGPFSYDFNSDALYQQYKDQYIQQGQMAMMDTMGQAAAMTGGYGNSYAQTVGQQAYNQQLGQLNDIMPELYGMAYDRYQQEGQELLNMYDLYAGLSEESYNHYLGDVDNYYRQLGAASDYANTLYGKEYGEWTDKTKMDFDTWSANTNLSFDEWATRTGILSDENNTLMNQKFQSEEAQKDRDFQSSENQKSREFTASENAKDRAKAASNAALKSPYSNLNTEDTMTWVKRFEGAKDLNELDRYTTALQGIIGPEAAAVWYDTYAKKFADDGDKVPIVASGGGGGGTWYMTTK